MELTSRLIRETARAYPKQDGVDFEEEERQLELLPVAFAEGSWRWEDLEWLVDWKSRRAAGYFEDNDPQFAEEILDQAIEARGIVEKVETLTELKGVGVPMASAFLVFMDPTAYTVLDVRAWESLAAVGHIDTELSETPTIDQYLTYLGVCHPLANEFEVELRTLDRALWVLSQP